MKPLPLANSLAGVTALCWVVGSILVWLFPGFSLYVTKVFLMGLEGVTLTGWNLDAKTFIVGLVVSIVWGWLFGYVWGWLYHRFDK